ncbi:MAG: transposase [Rhodoferax sp.]|nr:transposase [Rhodoferax sp.]
MHFRVGVVDGVFEAVSGAANVDTDLQSLPTSVIFHPASGVDAAVVAQVQTTLGKRILRAFVGRVCWRDVTPKRCWAIRTVVSRSMLVSASNHTTALRWSGYKRGARADEITLTPLELIARIAALVPPPRTHRHRHFGVLAPNSPLRAAVTALAALAQPVAVQAESQAVPAQPVPLKRPAHYLWAVLIARILRPCGTDRSYAQRTSSVLN